MTLLRKPTHTVARELDDGPAPVRPEAGPAPAARVDPAQRLVLYGDFNCPWSYLASRRAALLAADGVEIDWRAVEHDAPRRRASLQTSTAGHREDAAPPGPVRLGPLLDEMQEVLAFLLPGEELPYALAGFAPHTGAAVAAYAEAYRAGVAAPVRQVLFEALWLHAFDLDDPYVVHTLIIDAVRSGATGTGPLAAWEYGTGVRHQADASTQQLLDGWADEWRQHGNQRVPTLVADGEQICGIDAVMWLGAEVVHRGLVFGGASQATWARPTRAS
jgi:2-hydroxychromene-2-carboxylate isomerase